MQALGSAIEIALIRDGEKIAKEAQVEQSDTFRVLRLDRNDL